MSGAGNISAVMPGPPGVPIADENGNITVAWRGYFQVLQRRTGGTAGIATSDVAGSVTDEATARANADAAEATARENADTAEATARANADSAEASARSAADNTLQANITAEAVTRASADAAIRAALRNANYCDNSGFLVNQRGYVSGTPLAAGVIGHDRWKGGAGGCTYAFAASPPSTMVTITAGTLLQIVEGQSIAGGNYMLSWVGTARGRVGGGAYGPSPVTAAGFPAGTDAPIEFNAGTLSQVKFEAGTLNTPWAARRAVDEVAACQRFFQNGNGQLYFYAPVGGAGQAVPIGIPTMRALPTVAVGITSNTNGTGVGMGAQSLNGLSLVGSSVGAGQVNVSVSFTASADL